MLFLVNRALYYFLFIEPIFPCRIYQVSLCISMKSECRKCVTILVFHLHMTHKYNKSTYNFLKKKKHNKQLEASLSLQIFSQNNPQIMHHPIYLFSNIFLKQNTKLRSTQSPSRFIKLNSHNLNEISIWVDIPIFTVKTTLLIMWSSLLLKHSPFKARMQGTYSTTLKFCWNFIPYITWEL